MAMATVGEASDENSLSPVQGRMESGGGLERRKNN
jgi:hypothetical protein